MAVPCQPAWCLLKLNQAEQAPDRHKYGNHYGRSLLLDLYELEKRGGKKVNFHFISWFRWFSLNERKKKRERVFKSFAYE